MRLKNEIILSKLSTSLTFYITNEILLRRSIVEKENHNNWKHVVQFLIVICMKYHRFSQF